MNLIFLHNRRRGCATFSSCKVSGFGSPPPRRPPSNAPDPISYPIILKYRFPEIPWHHHNPSPSHDPHPKSGNGPVTHRFYCLPSQQCGSRLRRAAKITTTTTTTTTRKKNKKKTTITHKAIPEGVK